MVAADGYGILFAALGVGALIAALSLGIVKRRLPSRQVLTVAAAGFATAFAGAALAPAVWVAIPRGVRSARGRPR